MSGIDDDVLAGLRALATRARDRAHPPFSGFHVGCALLLADGRRITGANVESMAYPLSTCAERVALGAAIADTSRPVGPPVRVEAVVVVGPDGVPCPPCGGCRQLLVELAPGSVVDFSGEDGVRVTTTPEALLPGAFTLDA